MKKLVFLLMLLLFPLCVNAESYNTKVLIDANTKVSVISEKFEYNNFIYNTKVDEKGYSLISFESIKNNTVSKTPVSINLLLFGEDSKNIGFVAYCSDKDLDSNYSGYKLSGNSSAPFSISVGPKYFVEGKSASDVKYIAVLDDNKYCQIGGYDKYSGLTLDEIVNGVSNNKKVSGVQKLIIEIQEKGLLPIIIITLVGIAGLVILIMVISVLAKKSKERRIAKAAEVNIDVPMEETVDLNYDKVDNETYESEEVVSMGEVDNTVEDNNNSVEENTENREEDEEDLTKYFN